MGLPYHGIGRKKMYMIGCATIGIFGFIYFGLIDTGLPVLIFIAIVASLIPHDMQYGPQAALIAEALIREGALGRSMMIADSLWLEVGRVSVIGPFNCRGAHY